MLDRIGPPSKLLLVSSIVPLEVRPEPDRRHALFQSHSTHAHRHREILLPLSGRTRYGYRGVPYPCAPGTCFFFDSFEPHDNGYPSFSPDVVHVWISVAGDRVLARRTFVSGGKMTTRGTFHGPFSLSGIGIDFGVVMETCRAVAARHADLARAELVGALCAILARLVAVPAQADERRERRTDAIDAVARYLSETAGSGASLDSLADIAGYSKFHFLRRFKERTGLTVHAYVDRCRLRRVAAMRAEGRKLREIGEALGFSCPTAFSRWYRQKRQAR